MKEFFNYKLIDKITVFSHTLKKNSPYVAILPRDHESLSIITKGNLGYEKDGIFEVIKTGEVGYVSKGSTDIASAYMCDEVSYIGVNFSFGEPLESTLPFNTLCSKGITYEYGQLFKNMLCHYLLRTPGHMEICKGILMQIIGFLFNEHTTNITGLKKIQCIEQAIKYLHENYSSTEFKVSYLSEIVHMSEKNFRRIFNDIYGKSPYAFLQEFRISKAKEFLTQTNQSISGIAISCGFSDVYSFSHCFKNHMGLSPMEYRAQKK